jgi:tetratricopeptide (TPR) repeat protein
VKNLKLTILSILALSFVFVSCKRPATGNNGSMDTGLADQIRKERVAHNKKIYDMATKVHDNYTQLNALYNIMADDSSENLKNMDSVAEIYVRMGQYTASAQMAEKVLAKQPDNEKMMEIKAQVLMGKGKLAEALNLNRKLYEKTKKIKFLFNISEAQMQMGNPADANETFTKIKTSPGYQTDSIDVVDEQSGRTQLVPATAAMAYVEAMISYSKKDFKDMEAKLRQALTIDPQFTNPQRYMQALMQQKQAAQQQMQQQQMQRKP